MADKIATRQAYGQFLLAKGKEKKDLVVLDGDLSKSTMTASFAEAYPERFFNMGISEQNLYGVAAGMALSGKTVCASTFAMFASGRAFEIIRNSIGYTGANVKVCASHAGITVGEDGASHQTFEDIALMRTIPGMTVINPSDGNSAIALLDQAVEMDGPCYVRLGRSAVPAVYGVGSAGAGDAVADVADVKIGKGNCIRQGTDYTVVASGIMVNEALIAAGLLEKEGLSIRVIDMHTIKPLDGEILRAAAMETKGIVTAEEHSVIGGLGSAVAEFTSTNCPVKIAMVGQLDTFGESGKPTDLMEKYHMTAADIVKAVKQLVG